MTAAWVVLGAVAFLVLAVVVSYNRFVAQRTLVRNSWANIDTELQRRYDLVPSLVETVKGYAAHERDTLDSVVRARSVAVAAEGAPAEQAAAEGPLVGALRRLFAVAEQYPALRADDTFLGLQHELAVTEDRLQAARRFYNANVQELNRRVQAFPSNLIARQFGFTEEQYFEVEPAVREQAGEPPQVGF